MSKIYQLTFNRSGEVYFFGSIAAIYTAFDKKTIQVTPAILYRSRLHEKPFSNDVVTIRMGNLIRKKNKVRRIK